MNVNRDPVRRTPRSPLPQHVGRFIGAVLIASLLSLWPDMPPAAIPWWPLAVFASLTIVGEAVAIDTFGRGKTSVAIVPVLSATWLYGGLGVVATVSVLAIVAGIKARSPLHRVLFNFGMLVLAAQGARWSFAALAGRAIGELSLAPLILPAVGAGLVYYATNHVLLCMVRGLVEERRPWAIWQTDYRWLWPYYAVLGALGLLVALGYRTFGTIGILTLMAPAAMLHVAIKQYLDRSQAYVDDLHRMNDQLAHAYEATLEALTRALDTRDAATEEHSQRVRRYTELIAQRLQVSDEELAHISRGALLHDIGKIGVPDAILRKPGTLTEAERSVMRRHPEIGYHMIAHIPFLAQAALVVLHHHEAYDGSGYPRGLAGEQIPLGARIFAVADTFDAMTSDRTYRPALPPHSAVAELQRYRGTQFDPTIVDTFLALQPEEPMDSQR